MNNKNIIELMEIYDENFMRLFLQAESSEDIDQWTCWDEVEGLMSKCVDDMISVDKITRLECFND